MKLKCIIRVLILLFIIISSSLSAQTWIFQQSNTIENLNSVFFLNENVGWIVGNNGTILKTTDQGEDWNSQRCPVIKDLNSILFIDENNGIIVGEAGLVLKTSDGGGYWDFSYVDTSTFHSVYFVSEHTGWIVGDNNSIKKTNDGGLSWINQDFNSTFNFSFRDVYFVDTLKGWIPGHGNLEGIVLITNDGGLTWYYFAGGPNANSITMLSDQVGYIVGENGLVMKTSDGAIWFPQHDFGDDNLSSIYYRDEVTGWIAGEGGLIAKTLNKGEEWIIQNSGTAEQLNSLTFNNEFGWAVGNSGTIIHTIDSIGGFILLDWSKIFEAEFVELGKIKFLNDTLGFCNGAEEIYKTTDSGFNWSKIKMIERVLDFSFVDENRGFVLCRKVGSPSNPNIYLKTTNSGNSWEWGSISSFGFPLNKVMFVSADTGYMIGNGGIIKTTDWGNTWTLNYSISSNCLDIFFITNNIGWVVTLDGRLLKTTNGGNSWTEFNYQPSGYYHSAIALFFTDENIGFVGGAYYDGFYFWTGELMKTTNGGETWDISFNGPIQDIYMIDKNYGWFTSFGWALYYTIDGGEVWNLVDQDIVMRSIDFRNHEYGFGTVFYYDNSLNKDISKVYMYGSIPTDSSDADSSDVDPPVKNFNFYLYQNYPNPFNPSTIIRFEIPEDRFISLKVYDVLGREVATLLNEYKNAGIYEVEFLPESGSRSPASGVYFYQLKSKGFMETKKMLLLR